MRPTHSADEHYKLVSLAQRSETGERPHAEITMSSGGRESHSASDGNGPVEAIIVVIGALAVIGTAIVVARRRGSRPASGPRSSPRRDREGGVARP